MNYDVFAKRFNQSLSGFLGDLGSAKASVMLLKDTYSSNKGILAVHPEYVNHLKAVLMFTGCVRSLGVSGTMKKAKCYLKGC